jgi:hypothetical protein
VQQDLRESLIVPAAVTSSCAGLTALVGLASYVRGEFRNRYFYVLKMEPAVEIPEVAPARLDVGDGAGIKASLAEHGYACVRAAVAPAELARARDLLWRFLEGDEAPRMQQRRPVG